MKINKNILEIDLILHTKHRKRTIPQDSVNLFYSDLKLTHHRTISENEVTHKLPSEAPETRDEALVRLAAMQDKLDLAKQRLDAKTAFFMSSEKSQPGDKYQGIWKCNRN